MFVQQTRKIYHDDGTLHSETPYVNGQIHGVCKYYYESGSLCSKSPHVNGQKHGVYKRYYADGSLELEIHYFRGEEVKDFDQACLDIKFSNW